jgi:HSP20 family protein
MVLKRWGGHPKSLLREPVFAGLLDLSREMGWVLENTSGPVTGADAGPWAPPVDIFETTDDALVIVAELPGVKQEDVQVTVLDGTLTLGGERKVAPAGEGEVVLRRERAVGPFVRHVLLPATVDPARMTATYREGVLTIRAPKKETAKSRTIAIDVN